MGFGLRATDRVGRFILKDVPDTENRAFVSLSSSSSAILREEVKYVHTDTDLLAMEKAARGKKDIVLGYVRSLGTQGMEKKERTEATESES